LAIVLTTKSAAPVAKIKEAHRGVIIVNMM